MPTTAGERCRCKHFLFHQKYRSCPHASAGDWYPVLPLAALAVDLQLSATYRKVAFASATDAEYKLADAFTDALVYVCTRMRVVDVYRHIRKHMHVCAAMCVRERVHRNVLVCTSLLRCCAYNRFLCLAKGGWWEGRGEQLTITPVPRTLNGPLLQLKLDVCLLSASCNSYKGLQMSKCY